MSRLVTINQLVEITGLGVSTIRRRVAAGTLPYTRANTSTKVGKLLFDAELVQEILRQELIRNLKGCNMGDEPKEPTPENTSYLASLFKVPEDISEAEAEAERDARFGYEPRNTVKSASFTK